MEPTYYHPHDPALAEAEPVRVDEFKVTYSVEHTLNVGSSPITKLLFDEWQSCKRKSDDPAVSMQERVRLLNEGEAHRRALFELLKSKMLGLKPGFKIEDAEFLPKE